MTGEAVQVTTTLDSPEAAGRIARVLVEERLAACVQVQGPITSTYRWEASVHEASEWYCHAKTTSERLPEVVARIRELHSYVTPEIVAVRLSGGLPEYLRWIADATRGEA